MLVCGMEQDGMRMEEWAFIPDVALLQALHQNAEAAEMSAMISEFRQRLRVQISLARDDVRNWRPRPMPPDWRP